MPSVDYQALAGQILQRVGGESNIASIAHCATRLRLSLKDESRADKAAVEKLTGVIAVINAGGQFQVVIGNNVPLVYEELIRTTSLTPASPENEPGAKTDLLSKVIELISSIFLPILWPLAGAGLIKAFLTMSDTFSWVDSTTTTYIIVSAISDAIFYFMPMFLAVNAAKRFGANQFTAMAIAGSLVYPTVVDLAGSPDPVTFLGIPVAMMKYTSSVIPIVVAVWLQGYMERFLNKVLPHWLRNFTTPLLTMLLMVPLVLLTIGPASLWLSTMISAGVNALFATVPWLAGAVMGGGWQLFVMLGLHWGFVPILVNDLATQGYSLITGPLPSAVLAQAAAGLAVLLRSRSANRRSVAGPSMISSFLAGVTEPIIYGVNLPLKKPFYFGIAGGAIGGAIAAVGGSAANAFVFPSLITLPSFIAVGNFTLQLIGIAVAVTIAFVLTFIFVDREQEDAPDEPTEAVAVQEAGIDLPSSKDRKSVV